ncbi:hypothetical protein E3J62_05305 [candidate division TA06 bacterium]|uniref:Uncharacterized protein n=1 Tax=candidate division TA06 bacterium TaxID=2250710 RepID=A0A523UU99_UNCT6|nr:MAG: hypothetical protein E3J62_05305 [candidate division TA06 bacterium]
MRKKKPDIYERQKQQYWEAYDHAPLLKEKFPQLASLVIEMTFQEPDWGSNPSPRQENYGPGSKAFFEMTCPYVECISGGFNLSSAVSKLVASGEIESSGFLTCHGWQDRERVNKHRCLLKMEYKIIGNYAKNV